MGGEVLSSEQLKRRGFPLQAGALCVEGLKRIWSTLYPLPYGLGALGSSFGSLGSWLGVSFFNERLHSWLER